LEVKVRFNAREIKREKKPERERERDLPACDVSSRFKVNRAK